VALERDRWRAQDVLLWFYAGRRRRWRRDTGLADPSNEPAAAEVWLGAHRPGSVPQLYRAITAGWTTDPRRFAAEVAAMPETTPLERALKLWVVGADQWVATGDADTAELGSIVDGLAAGEERDILRSWLAIVEASRRWSRRERGWIEPIVAAWPAARRETLGRRHRVRLWLSRFIVVPVFLITATVVASLGSTIAAARDAPPAAYTDTDLSIRGEMPFFDAGRTLARLPRLERALPAAVRADPRALDADDVDRLIGQGLPTVIWTTGRIDLAGPADAAGRRVWEIEVLLGGLGPNASTAIVTFERPDGPQYLYRIDRSVVSALREAAGLPVAGSTP
jgi:hypothetical protein